MNEFNRTDGHSSDETVSLVERYAAIRKKRIKKIIIVLSVIVIAVALAFTAFYFIKKYSYRTTVEEFMDAYKSGSITAVFGDLTSSYYTARKLQQLPNTDMINFFNDNIANAHKTFKENLGEEYEISYKINSTSKMRQEEYDSMVQSLSFGPFNAKNNISSAMRVEITVTAKAEDKELTHAFTLLLTKEEGRWFVLDFK